MRLTRDDATDPHTRHREWGVDLRTTPLFYTDAIPSQATKAMAEEEPKTRRRTHTKSRNGCVNCKKRRVKCDETHPECRNCRHLELDCKYLSGPPTQQALQMMELSLFHHYITVVAHSIAEAGIGTDEVWCRHVPELACKYDFLMHAVIMLSASHLNQSEPNTYEIVVVTHRSQALRLLRAHMEKVTSENMDALVATSVLMILDAMANAASPDSMTLCSLPASTWLHHVRGAATIFLAVGELPTSSKFFSFMGRDMFDFANIHTALPVFECFDERLRDLYPVDPSSPYFPALAHLDRLHTQQHMPDYILRVFSFPALMDPILVEFLKTRDPVALRIVGVYYSIVREYCVTRAKQLWFLKGVAQVLPIDLDQQMGGLGFIDSALPVFQNIEGLLSSFDASFQAANGETEDAFSMFSGEFEEVDCNIEDPDVSQWFEQ